MFEDDENDEEYLYSTEYLKGKGTPEQRLTFELEALALATKSLQSSGESVRLTMSTLRSFASTVEMHADIELARDPHPGERVGGWDGKTHKAHRGQALALALQRILDRIETGSSTR